jgi:hypothetical protein
MIVADHEAMTVLVALVGVQRDVGVDLGLGGGGQHPLRPWRQISSSLTASSSPAGSSVTTLNIWRSFLARAATPAFFDLVKEEGTRRPSSDGRSTGSG